MNITLKVWRQKNTNTKGKFETYKVNDITEHMSFLEMIDVLNQQLIKSGDDPVSFDHDCREGICGTCSMYINGRPHGPGDRITTCQLHMRSFSDGDTITIEPWRASAFPIIKDLVVDRTAFDKIIQAGGYISVNTGVTVDANSVPVEHSTAEEAMDAATCIGCGACVAACKNASANLFLAAKVAHLALLPQGDPERKTRVIAMVDAADEAGFGSCTNTAACEAECPKGISIKNIALMNREYYAAVASVEE